MAVPGNLLRHETSPYLLQHAENPVAWRGWNSETLAEARRAGKPILLSIGYAACHWCHVMAHESFEDPAVAALMNDLYVCIKVDREERPDIDHVYMAALHALGEQGGWPLTMFLTPEGEPFWGGTYFPPEPRWGRPSFPQVLRGVADAYRTQQDAVRENAAALRATLARLAADNPGPAPGPAALDRAAAALLRMVDTGRGGLKGAPKFPNAPLFRFLWQNARRTGAPEGTAAVHLLLTRMSQGGIYDHLGGGFARYATDAAWLVPHFEKMLYDNAQLLELLALAHADRPDSLYRERAEETVGWLLRDMRAATVDGHAAFAASEDADSEGEEGRFYVWTEAEIDAALGPDSPSFKRAYDVTPGGNWEGKTILQRILPCLPEEQEVGLASARSKLFRIRSARPRPGRDDKVLADWNGLAIAALCRAAAVFARPAWQEHAADAHAFIRAAMRAPDGRMQHAWRLGRVAAAGLLDDQAAMARAALALFEATADDRYLADAIALAEAAERWFGAEGGGFRTSAADASDLPFGGTTRPRTAADDATPAANGVMAEVLARLYHLTGDARWRDRAQAVLAAFGGLGERLTACPTLLAAADLLEAGATVVVAGRPDTPEAAALRSVARAAADPAVCVLAAPSPAALPPLHPAYGKAPPAGTAAAAFICRAGVCSLPVADPRQLAAWLADRRAGAAA
ncbi:MAG: thioredoxin domain-containing protein [Alphaproteobacteria bacterium]|nr:thioredoxin domain-containing protein [Alphaproteobacteria bacterium]